MRPRRGAGTSRQEKRNGGQGEAGRFDTEQGGRIGAVKGDGVVDLVAAGSRWSTIRDIAGAGSGAIAELGTLVERAEAAHKLADVRLLAPIERPGKRLLAPIERPGKYRAIGMNYAKHLEEADKLGVKRSAHQTWFNKQTTCISGPYAIEPGVTEKLDYEVELATVISARAKRVSEADAPAYVFGYTVANDVSARGWQFHTPTFTMGKSFDTHGPIGPWIVTADEIADPHALGLRAFVNGELRQENNTGQIIHNL